MNYLIDLTEEDIRYVCSAIPYQETTSYFKRYPKEFAKLRPGFRVKSLTKEMVSRTLYEFRTRDFVSTYWNCGPIFQLDRFFILSDSSHLPLNSSILTTFLLLVCTEIRNLHIRICFPIVL